MAQECWVIVVVMEEPGETWVETFTAPCLGLLADWLGSLPLSLSKKAQRTQWGSHCWVSSRFHLSPDASLALSDCSTALAGLGFPPLK